jgi:3-keto-5-aminohexanoate cleavage enzyme
MVGNCLRLIDEGLIEQPLWWQFVLGVPGGAPAEPRTLLHMVDMLPAGSQWSVIGIGRGQLPMNRLAIMTGGHVRTGLEDNIYLKRGVLAESNAQFVERLARLTREFGREVATPADARRLLGLRGA